MCCVKGFQNISTKDLWNDYSIFHQDDPIHRPKAVTMFPIRLNVGEQRKIKLTQEGKLTYKLTQILSPLTWPRQKLNDS